MRPLHLIRENRKILVQYRYVSPGQLQLEKDIFMTTFFLILASVIDPSDLTSKHPQNLACKEVNV